MNDINFFSQHIENRREKGKKNGLTVLIAIVILAISIGIYILNQRKIERLESELKVLKIEMSSDAIKEGLNNYKNIEERTKILTMYHENLIEAIDKIDKIYNVNSYMINDIKRVMPAKMFITSMNGNSESIFMQGVATNRIAVAEFQHNLKKLKYFSDAHVNVISSEHAETENLVFTVKCYFEDVTENEAK